MSPIAVLQVAQPQVSVPPPWWPLLTASMRKTILTRLRVKGVDTTTWPK